MNDREMFWSLISPHLVDRPDVTNRFNYGIDEVIGNWQDLSRFVVRNHKLILPSQVRWRELTPLTEAEWLARGPQFIGESTHIHPRKLVDTYMVIPLEQYPYKMVILSKNFKLGVDPRLFFDLRDVIVEIPLIQMHQSKTDYVMRRLQIHGKPVEKDKHWAYIIDLPVYGKGLFQYAVWPTMPSFINWNNDPFTLK